MTLVHGDDFDGDGKLSKADIIQAANLSCDDRVISFWTNDAERPRGSGNNRKKGDATALSHEAQKLFAKFCERGLGKKPVQEEAAATEQTDADAEPYRPPPEDLIDEDGYTQLVSAERPPHCARAATSTRPC